MSETSEQAVTNAELKRQFKWQDIALVLAILGGFGSGYVHLIGSARAQAQDGVAPLKAEVEILRADLDEHKKDAGENQRQIKAQVFEQSMDIRALYKAIMTGNRQPRLEVPPADAGER